VKRGPVVFERLPELLAGLLRDTNQANAIREHNLAEHNRKIANSKRQTEAKATAMDICREFSRGGQRFTWKHVSNKMEKRGVQTSRTSVQRYLAEFRKS